MGLFDQVTGMLGGQAGKAEQLQKVFSWVEEQGGVKSLIEKFHQGGLSAVVESWIGSGNNLPVTAEQIQSVLGLPAIQQLAEKLGVNSDNASTLIAEYLPKLVDGLSPDGEIQPHKDLVSQGLDFLKGKFFS